MPSLVIGHSGSLLRVRSRILSQWPLEFLRGLSWGRSCSSSTSMTSLKTLCHRCAFSQMILLCISPWRVLTTVQCYNRIWIDCPGGRLPGTWNSTPQNVRGYRWLVQGIPLVLVCIDCMERSSKQSAVLSTWRLTLPATCPGAHTWTG